MAHLGLVLQVFRRKGYIVNLSSHLLALGAAVASVMSKSLGEKNQKPLPTMTESLKGDLIVGALLGGLRCYLDAR